MRVETIIVGAGKGKRFGEIQPKQFCLLWGKPVLSWTIERFEECKLVDKIILVLPPGMKEHAKKVVLSSFNYRKIKTTIEGGKHRGSSVFQGLQVIDEDTDIVLVHDGVRPLILPHLIEKLIYETKENGAVTLGIPIKETVKKTDKKGLVIKTLDRRNLYSIQTPQGFKKDLIWQAYKMASQSGKWASDDAALVERLGNKVKIILGDERNIKITTSFDLKLAETLLKQSLVVSE